MKGSTVQIIIAFSLGLIAAALVLMAIYILSTGRDIPPSLNSLISGAIGGLAGAISARDNPPPSAA